MLTTNVSRAQVLAGKILAGLTTLTIPTALGFILLMILLLGTENIEVGVGEWARVGLLLALSLLYLLVFYLIGLGHLVRDAPLGDQLDLRAVYVGAAGDCAARQYHGLAQRAGQHGRKKHKQAHHQAAQVWKEFDQKATDLVRAHGQTQYPPYQMVERLPPQTGRGTETALQGGPYSYSNEQIFGLYLTNVVDSPALAKFQDIMRTGERLRLKYAQRAWNAKAPLIENFPRRIQRWNAYLQRLLPAGAYTQAASAFAGTSRREYYDFIDQVRTYRGQIITFLEERDAFGSREWFNDDEGWRADLRDLPRFHERGWTVAKSLRHALPDLTALLLYAIVLFVVANRLFARYDAQ